jgi:hypothetical protein
LQNSEIGFVLQNSALIALRLFKILNSSIRRNSCSSAPLRSRQKTWVRFAKKALVLTVSAVAGFAVYACKLSSPPFVAGVANSQIQGPGLRKRRAQSSSRGRSRDVQPMINPPVRRHSGRSTRDPRLQSALNSLEKIGFVLQNSDLEPCSAKIATDGPICWRVAPTSFNFCLSNGRCSFDHRRLDCESLRIALFLRPAARFSYRRSLTQSESRYGASSNGSGIVVKGSIASGQGGWLGPRLLDRICSISGRQNGEVSGSPSAITHSITAFLSCPIRAIQVVLLRQRAQAQALLRHQYLRRSVAPTCRAAFQNQRWRCAWPVRDDTRFGWIVSPRKLIEDPYSSARSVGSPRFVVHLPWFNSLGRHRPC